METCNEYWQFLTNIQNAAWLEWVKASFDLIKGVSWPLAVFLVVWLFREQIKAKFSHVLQVGPTGAIFQAVPTQPIGQPSNPLQVGSHPLQTVNLLAEIIREELQGYVPEQREPRLIRALAEARVLGEFESIFGAIFQSQIDALKELLAGPKDITDAQSYFTEVVIPINRELYSQLGFEQWGTFLDAHRLVDVSENHLLISQKGRDFLEFARNMKSGFARPY